MGYCLYFRFSACVGICQAAVRFENKREAPPYPGVLLLPYHRALLFQLNLIDDKTWPVLRFLIDSPDIFTDDAKAEQLNTAQQPD